MAERRTILAIGNGPSLRGFDFSALEGCDTLGMNAAYRHWDRIGWYPTYYCCLDDQLIQTHHLEIRRLVEDNLVRGAFVHGSFFQLHPDCIRDERFWSFDQFNAHWFKKRGEATGRPFVESPAFATSDGRKVTTGSYAVRFCAHLGYEVIGLLGIDLKYVEILPEAEKGEGIALRIVKTPEHNPNYFFDDYQRAGDRYNVPNPEVHQGNLHVQSFRVLRDDFFQNRVAACVFNCNSGSALQEQAIFPFASVEKLLGLPRLASVVVPCTPGEVDQALANFHLWSQPAYAPFLHHIPRKRPKLVFVLNRGDDSIGERIRNRFELFGIGRFFSGVDIHVLGLEGDADAYIRSYDRPAGSQGYKAGPNNQFFQAMGIAGEYGPYTFLMETDCVPIRPNWLAQLSEIVDGAEPFFVLGSAYRGINTLARHYSRHINGNAVYAVGIPEFRSFLKQYWEPWLQEEVKHGDRRMAYDCILEAKFGKARSDHADDEIWRLWQRHSHKFRHTNFIQNISAKDDIRYSDPKLIQNILERDPETHIVHNQRLTKFICSTLPPIGSGDMADGAPTVVQTAEVPAPERREPIPVGRLSRLADVVKKSLAKLN